MKKAFLTISGFILLTASNISTAALIDFTTSGLSVVDNKITGTTDGVGYTVSTNGTLNINEGYDGSQNNGCTPQAPSLACNIDGIGVGNDELNNNEIVTLTFTEDVLLSGFYFLDLYDGSSRAVKNTDGKEFYTQEEATVTLPDLTTLTILGTETGGQGGFAELTGFSPITILAGQAVTFTADVFKGDDGNNDYALAGITVNAIPLPGAVWLFGSALVGFAGFNRFRKKSA